MTLFKRVEIEGEFLDYGQVRSLPAPRFGMETGGFPAVDKKAYDRHPISVGKWRTDEHDRMIVASGRPGKETIHFEVRHADVVGLEMDHVLAWLEELIDETSYVSTPAQN